MIMFNAIIFKNAFDFWLYINQTSSVLLSFKFEFGPLSEELPRVDLQVTIKSLQVFYVNYWANAVVVCHIELEFLPASNIVTHPEY